MKTKFLIVLLILSANLFAAPANLIDSYVKGIQRARPGDFITLTDQSDRSITPMTYRVVDIQPGMVVVQNSTGQITKTLLPNRKLADGILDRYQVSFVHQGQQAWEANRTWWYMMAN